MNTTLIISSRGPSTQWLKSWGAFLLWSVLGFGLLLILAVTWSANEFLPFIPVVLIAGALALALFKRPLLNLAVVMCGFVLIVGFQEGLQPGEIVYGLYYLGFLAHWFFTRSYLQQQVICRRPEERVLLAFLVLITLTIPISMMFDGWPSMILGEWLSFSMLAFYWPIREAITSHKNGLRVVVGSLIFVGVFVLARNLLEYRGDLGDAEKVWQIATSRAIINESLLMVPALLGLTLFLQAGKMRNRLFYLVLVLCLFAGLILTQSRAYWVAFFLGAGFIFLFVSKRDKVRLIVVGLLSAGGVFLIAYLVLGDFLLLVMTGLLDRFLTLQTAVSSDVSLINRFLEAKGVWHHIQVNPILGHGMGVPYRFYNITYEYSEIKTFVHNGYVALAFKFGVWGLGMMLFMMIRFFVRAVQNWHSKNADPLSQLISLSVAGSLAALSITSLTANPFFQNDLMFIYACLWGIAGGCYARSMSAAGEVHRTEGDPA